MSGSINGIAILAADSPRELVADIQFMEPYSSSAFNRKLRSIVQPGVYAGFDTVPGKGLNVTITSAGVDNHGVASVNVDDMQISVHQISDLSVTVAAGKLSVIALEAFYQFGVRTKQVDENSSVEAAKVVVLVDKPLAPNQIELCRVSVPAGATQITDDMIDTSYRVTQAIGIALSDSITSSRNDVAASSLAVKRLHDLLDSFKAEQQIVTWQYNGGSAKGGESVITVPDNIQRVAAVYVNGYPQFGKFSFDAATHQLTLNGRLSEGDDLLCMTNNVVESGSGGGTCPDGVTAENVDTREGFTVQTFIDSISETGMLFASTRATAEKVAMSAGANKLMIIANDEAMNHGATLVKTRSGKPYLDIVVPLSSSLFVDLTGPEASLGIGHTLPDGTQTTVGAAINLALKKLAEIETNPSIDYGIIK